MKSRNFFPYHFLLVFLFVCCSDQKDKDQQLWVGTNRVMDRNIPFPFLLEFSDKKFRLIDFRNAVIDSSTESGRDLSSLESIIMEEHDFQVLQTSPQLLLFDNKDSLNFPHRSPFLAARFVPVEGPGEIPIKTIRERLDGNSFKTQVNAAHFATPNRDLKVVKMWSFSEENLTTTFYYYYNEELVYKEKEQVKYQLFSRMGITFLSTYKATDQPLRIYQISGMTGNSFMVVAYRNGERFTEKMEALESFPPDAPIETFERCMPGQPGEYYHDDLNYSKGNEFLIRKIAKNAPKATGDGYITIHFTINCQGKLGHPGLEQMNLQFESASFDPSLVKHILTEVMQLDDWPEIKAGFLYKDIHAFLMFKIRNGKITDLCP